MSRYWINICTDNIRMTIQDYLAKISFSDCFKDLVNWSVGRQSTVKNSELSLQPARDVIATAPRLDHGGNILNIDDIREVTRFIKIVETTHLHKLTNYFIGDLGKERKRERGSEKNKRSPSQYRHMNFTEITSKLRYQSRADILTWSPHSFITGMLISSTKTVILLPAGGPKVVPIRLST